MRDEMLQIKIIGYALQVFQLALYVILFCHR